jgi:predicted ATPase
LALDSDVPAAGSRSEPPPAAAVRAELRRIVASAPFASAPSLCRLLEHLVQHALSGGEAPLNEYAIAVDVFDRSPAFDPRTDTIVRVQARRVRAKLEAYYDGEGRGDPVVIEVAKGHYAARFRFAGGPAPAGGRLPFSCTPLVGRQREVSALRELLLANQSRLITVAGVGGSGKTRLAQEVASAVREEFTGGVHFVSLAAVTDAEGVVATLSQVLGLRQTGGRPLADALLAHAQLHIQRPTLLLLDNLEHVMTAAPLLIGLLQAAAPLVILATSRSVLRLSGEHVYSLLPLPLPDPEASPSPDALADNPAVALFVQRASAASPAFAFGAATAAAIAEICRRLDGLPLALELAAARMGMLSAGELLARLEKRLDVLTLGARDLPPRQQTLRNTIEWSHQLLDEAERRLFRRLSVFAGGCTMEGAEAVGNARLDLSVDVLEGMTSLVDKNLLQRQDGGGPEPRFRMLDTIRAYAVEQLGQSGERSDVQRAHAAYCLVLAEEGTGLERRADWVARCEREHDNFHAALDYLVAEGEAGWALRLGAALYLYWDEREYFAEGSQRLERILQLSSAPTAARAMCSKFAGALATHQGDFAAARRRHREALDIYQELGDRKSAAGQLVALGAQEYLSGHAAEARPFFEGALAICRALGDSVAIASSLSDLANCLSTLGETGLAQQSLTEALTIFTHVGNGRGVACSLNQLGDVARDRGDYAEARRLYEQGAELFRRLADPWGQARSRLDLGRLASLSGEPSAAREHLEQALDMFARLDHRRGAANALDELACVAADGQDLSRALILAGAASELRSGIGAVARPGVQARLERVRETARQDLEPGAMDAAWTSGRRLSLEQARRYALGVTLDEAQAIRS